MTYTYGMAVLFIRLTCCWLSYIILSNVEWRYFLKDGDERHAFILSLLLSVATGYAISSFMLSIIEITQNLILSLF